MSQKAPPRNNWMVYIWLFMLFFLGLQFFNKPAPDNRSEQDVFKAIQAQGQLVKSTSQQQHIWISEAIKELQEQRKIPDLLQASDKLSADEDLQQMRILSELGCDTSIRSVETAYEQRIDSDRSIQRDQKDLLKLQSQVMVADTLLKQAAVRHDMNRVAMASGILIPLARTFDATPLWLQTISVPPDKNYPASLVSPKQVNGELNALSTSIGKSTDVFGFFPGYKFVDFVVHLTGAVPGLSYWLAALMLAILVRGLVYPVSQRQMMWSRQMQQLTPLINEIKEQYKNKPNAQAETQQRTMELYKEYGMNPLAGCVPAFIQMPVFLLIYYSMLTYRFEFQRGTFLWINPSTSAASHGFLARSLGEKDYLLIVIYAITMVTTALLQPVTDPSNIRQQRIMGVSMSGLFGIMMFFWPVPSAFILYWTFTNILATAQSLRSYRLPLPPLVKKNAPNGGVFPTAGSALGGSRPGVPGIPSNGKLNGKPKSTGTPKIHKPKKKK